MFGQLALVVGAGLLGPLLAAGRRQIAPVLIGELIAGALIGRTGFQLIDPSAQPFPVFYALGFAMLMLGAGSEVDLDSPELRRGVVRGALALVVVIAVAVPTGFLLSSVLRTGHVELLVVLLAGSSAAIAFPTLEERHIRGDPVVLLIGWIALADGVTALLMPLSLSGANQIVGALVGDAIILLIGAALVLARDRLAGRRITVTVVRQSRERRWALQLRLSVLLLLVVGAIAERSGGSLLVAGFVAGIVLRRFREPDRLILQLSGLANGFFVPAFFVLLGATLDLRTLVTNPAAAALAFAMALGSVAVHLVGAAIAGRERRLATGLVASAQLGLPAAAAALGIATHTLTPGVAAALVAGGCLTLIPALVGATLLGRQTKKA